MGIMLGRKFYIIFSLLFVVLFFGSMWYANSTSFKVFEEKWELRGEGEDILSITKDANSDGRVKVANYVYLGAKILAGIYWVFMVVLAIQLHQRGFASMLDVILVVVLAPLAIVFYFLTLNGKLKKAQRENNVSVQG